MIPVVLNIYAFFFRTSGSNNRYEAILKQVQKKTGMVKYILFSTDRCIVISFCSGVRTSVVLGVVGG